MADYTSFYKRESIEKKTMKVGGTSPMTAAGSVPAGLNVGRLVNSLSRATGSPSVRRTGHVNIPDEASPDGASRVVSANVVAFGSGTHFLDLRPCRPRQ